MNKMEDQRNFFIFSTADWDNPFWTNKQHTASRLAKRGHKVFYIESLGLRQPTLKAQDLSRILRRLKSFFKGARQVQENVWVYSPIVIPLHRYKFVRILNKVLLKGILLFYKRKFKLNHPIAWTYNPMVLELMESLSPSKKVYHSVDDLSASPGIDSQALKEEEARLLKKMDVVFCTSKNIYNHCSKIAGKEKTHYFSNVVDYEHFSKAKTDLSQPKELKNIPHPRLGFVGALSSYKVDFDLIKQVADERPDWHWILIGKVGEGQPETTIEDLQHRPNIHLLGPKDYKDLPQYIKYFDVCTIPCPKNDYTDSMFPMKFYEFMATEKPIIAKNIDSLSDVTHAHFSYSKDSDFIDGVESILSKKSHDTIVWQELVKENTWETRLNKMFKVLQS